MRGAQGKEGVMVAQVGWGWGVMVALEGWGKAGVGCLVGMGRGEAGKGGMERPMGCIGYWCWWRC